MIETIKNVGPQEILDSRKGVDLLISSFRFSQGLPALQREIFRYLHDIYPNSGIDDSTKNSITTEAMPTIRRFLKHTPEKAANINPAPIILHSYLFPDTPTNTTSIDDVDTKIEKEAKNRIDDMQEIFNTDPGKNPFSIHSIIRDIVARDFKFLYEKNGRPRNNPDQTYPMHDPWLSHLCHYGLNGNATGLPEFDQMFKDVNDCLKNYGTSMLSWQTDSQLDHVMRIYNENHPQTPVKIKYSV